jgi:hypothetical protein
VASLEEVVRALVEGARLAAEAEQARAASGPKPNIWELVRRLHADPRVETDDGRQPS